MEERSFHGSSRHLALLIAVAYCTWLLVVRTFFGKVSGCCGHRGRRSACRSAGATARSARAWRGGRAAAGGGCRPRGPTAAAHPRTLLQFPYPILNKLPFPLGFVGFVLLGFAVVLATFQLGKSVKRVTTRALNQLLLGSESGAGSAPARRSNGRQGGSAAAAAKAKEQ